VAVGGAGLAVRVGRVDPDDLQTLQTILREMSEPRRHGEGEIASALRPARGTVLVGCRRPGYWLSGRLSARRPRARIARRH
jgi:hypothetical protein